jgi:hypothetical protein
VIGTVKHITLSQAGLAARGLLYNLGHFIRRDPAILDYERRKEEKKADLENTATA